MRWAILSDIHANALALEAVLEDGARYEVERILCLGDIVGYGPQPAETLARIRKVATAVVAGNHDDAVSGRGDTSCFIDLAADAVARHRAELSRADRRWLGSLPYSFYSGSFSAVHGEPNDPAAFGYITNVAEAASAFAVFAGTILFVGHTHIPAIFVLEETGSVQALEPTNMVLEPSKRYIINPGSVGYPRSDGGACFASYVIYDDLTHSIVYRYIPFAVSSVLQRGRVHRRMLPWVLAGSLLLLAAIVGGVVFQRQFTSSTNSPQILNQGESSLQRIVFKAGSLARVRPAVKLARDSIPIAARIVFRDDSGKILATEWRSVKQSWRSAIPVPRTAVSAELFAVTNGARVLRMELMGVPAGHSHTP